MHDYVIGPDGCVCTQDEANEARNSGYMPKCEG